MTKQFFAQIALDDVSAKGSYGIGLQIGQQLVDSKLAVKAEAVAKGIYDALNQNPPALELNEVAQALQELQQQAAEAAQAQFKQIEEEGKKYL
ncbi:FKBP-type peptidyl-prolyl cis-trans isomerase N-terminal domain-containing protein, partial [Tessaracoccus sp. OH4464_COT-324]|uniref:FKBP-type peptidyl-prolyl cis-trans isomerase N-terminal domain-containing protein n=1 Tax=Tessaracoccus sp. OH4464_COT-324 TaxID=2491059 RepID=UPI000FB34665